MLTWENVTAREGETYFARCIESAEYLCAVEGWKGYIIAHSEVEGRFVFAPLTQKNRVRYDGRVVVVVKRKRKSNV
jgi:hypothetical protein